MKTISIRLFDNNAGTTEDVAADFEDEDIALFEDYIANTERLLESTIVRDGMLGNLKFNYDQAEGFSYEVNLPSEDSIVALLHRLRLIILQDERSSYNTITGILRRRFDNTRIRSMIKSQRKIYDGRNLQNTVQVLSNGVIINSEKTLFDWLNAFEYHNDKAKIEEIKNLHQLMPLDTSRAIFLMLLTEKVKSIVEIAKFLGLLLGNIDTLEARA